LQLLLITAVTNCYCC